MGILKSYLAGNRLGQFALDMSSKLGLVRAALSDLEKCAIKSNDIISSRLRDALCRDGMIFVDVGCHIGSVLGAVKANAKPARLIAVEAIPEKVVSLRKYFPDVEFHECAVGDHEGEVEFTIVIGQSGYSSLNPDIQTRGAVKVIKVPMLPMDAFLPMAGIDVMKIDVEGAELGALRGAEKVVAGSRPVIVFESGPSEMEGFPKAELFRWFGDHDYDVVLPNRVAHDGPPTTFDVFMDAHEYPRRTTDFFGIPRERRTEVRDRARRILAR